LDFGIVIAAAVDLLGSFFDYEQEHEQEFLNASTHHDASICFLISERNTV